MQHQVRVWDLPTRVFHWALALCIVALVITGQIGGSAMEWHFRFGYSVLTLLLFRILWGLFGGRWSRFASFVYSPGSFVRYLKGEGKPEHTIGHNPLGSLSVFALLFLLLIQISSGLISDDEIMASGPLTRFVSNALVGQATFYHKEVGKIILIFLLTLHLAAIFFYLLKKKENLIKPMIVGDKIVSVSAPGSRDDLSSRLFALVLLIICAALVYGMLRFAAP